MSTFALTDAVIWAGGYDLSGDSNSVTINSEVEDLEVTTFGSSFRSRIGGLRSVSMDVSGFWQAGTGTVDPELFSALGVRNRVVTVAPEDAEGATAYMFRAGIFSYEMFGAVGEATPFSISAQGTDGQGLIRGKIAKGKATVSSTGPTGTPVNLGAVGAGQFLYATFHVFSAGTTITVDVESDVDGSFGGPTTVATLGPVTSAGGTWAVRVPGPITDTHFRFNVDAVTGSFVIAGAIGIGS
jgi:hypothetical protein